MPYEQWTDEDRTIWCPKWYWPFAVCTRRRRVQRWCYRFSWVKATGYGVLTHYEACENGQLYIWDEPFSAFLGESRSSGCHGRIVGP